MGTWNARWRQRVHRYGRRASIAAIGIVLAVELIGAGSTRAVAQKPELVPVRWGGTISIELETPLFVAMHQGYFAEEGLKIDNVMLAPGPRVREALATNELDFGDVGTFTYIVGRRKNLPQRVILEYYTKEIFSLFVPVSHTDEIRTVSDLKGRKIVVTALGSSSHMAALSFIRKAGLKDTDVTFVGINSADPAVWVTAFKSGDFAAGVVWEPISTFLLDRKEAVALIDVRNPAAHEKWIGKTAASMVLSTSERMIEKNPSTVQHAINAIKKALAYIRGHSASDVAEAAAPGFKMDVNTLTRILVPIKENFSKDGAISRSGIGVEVGLALTGGVLKKALPFEDMVDTRFAGSTQ
jgi:NitT/TauT family transport system substrate-binding protein